MKETCIEKEVIYDGKIIRVEKDKIELEDGHQSMREVVFNSGGVCVLAFDDDNNVILGKQFRYPSQEELYELPGGKQDGNEDYVTTGLRELKEETGYVSEDCSYFGYLYPTVAYCSEVIHMVVAKHCHYEKQVLDDGEHVEPIIVPYEKVKQMIFDNEIKDGKTIVAFLKYDAMQR